MSYVPVTVIVPFYEGHRFIERAISSLERQSVLPREVVIVDDGSETRLESVESEKISIRIVTHDKQKGIPFATNTGLQASSQTWISFLDQDDTWKEYKLERQWQAVKTRSDREDVIIGRIEEALPNGERVLKPRKKEIECLCRGPHTVRALLTYGNIAPKASLLLRRELAVSIGGFNEELQGGADDYEFVVRLAAEGARFVVDSFEKPVAVRHIHGSNYSHPGKFAEDEATIITELTERYDSVKKYANRGWANYYTKLGAARERADGSNLEALWAYLRAIAHYPFNRSPWMKMVLMATPDIVINRGDNLFRSES